MAEWVKAEINFEDEVLVSRTLDYLSRVGLGAEDLDAAANSTQKEFWQLIREADRVSAIGEAAPLIEWYSRFCSFGKTRRGGPPTLSKDVRNQFQQRLAEGEGNRTALRQLLVADAAARAYSDVTGEQK